MKWRMPPDLTQRITLVIPRPSLVNLQEKKLRPVDQDNSYICFCAVQGHHHETFKRPGMQGVVMGSRECQDRMVIAVADLQGVVMDTQPYFRLNSLLQDLILNADGSFYERHAYTRGHDYGAAVSVTFTLEPGAAIKIPVAVVMDFPSQRYNDGQTLDRKYIKAFKDKKTRTLDMANTALTSYTRWLDRTLTIQGRIYDLIRKSPSYKGDKTGALRLTRLILNELSYPLSNAAVWTQDQNGRDVARFLECFDYPYLNPSDVDWYSMVLLILFPGVEKELCQRFIDSIQVQDLSPRHYHLHAAYARERKHFEDHPEAYKDWSPRQVRDASKIKGSVAHDLGALTRGNPLRNVSDYAWYNNNYWVDLFPKLALRVLRDVKVTGDQEFLERNWTTLKLGFDFLQTLDIDGDGVPEGHPDDVKNTFDNLTLFGVDAYSANLFLSACQAMMKMADMMADAPARAQYRAHRDRALAVYETLWRDTTNGRGLHVQYYLTCHDTETRKANTDVWTNQFDGLWSLIAMGEEPLLPADRVRQSLKTIYENNRTLMGWATARTQDGEPVESDQGKDVWIASNYVLAQLLEHYGLVAQSKGVYQVMDRVIFQHGNSLISPESVRPGLEREPGETKDGPHYIVAGYPRPGAVLTHVVLQFIKDTKAKMGQVQVDSGHLKSFVTALVK